MPQSCIATPTHDNADCLAMLGLKERTRCEVWTRVMGYHRPVSAWNKGKQSEHQERCYFQEVHESP